MTPDTETQPPRDTASYLVRTVEMLWPGAEVVATRSRRADPRALAEFVVVPHLRAPRLLVPASDAIAAGNALRRFSAAATPREIWSRAALATTVRAGGLVGLPHRITAHGSATESLVGMLSQALGEPVSFSLGVGTERVNRKPVLQLFGDHGRVLGFAKIGDSEQARKDVRGEARALAVLADREWRSFTTPRLLLHTSWRDLEVLVMSALPQSLGQHSGDRQRAPLVAMTELAQGFAETPARFDQLGWTSRQRQIAERLSDSSAGSRLVDAIDATAARAGDRHWTPVAWHGDWTPWNMARHRGRIQLWDWERFECGVPQGMDALHYVVNVATRQRGTTSNVIGSALKAAAGSDSRSQDHQLAAAYLIAVAGRYLPLCELPGGQHISQRAEQVLDVLGDWTGTG